MNESSESSKAFVKAPAPTHSRNPTWRYSIHSRLPIASALANAVRIAEAERLSQTDDLTKLHNARYLRQFLLNEIRRARRYGSSVAALFLDLDDFKRDQRRTRPSRRFSRTDGNGSGDSLFHSRHGRCCALWRRRICDRVTRHGNGTGRDK